MKRIYVISHERSHMQYMVVAENKEQAFDILYKSELDDWVNRNELWLEYDYESNLEWVIHSESTI